MAVENIDFEDLPEDDFSDKEKIVNITVKVSENTREMFGKVAHRERRNMASLGAIIIEDWLNEYVDKYKKNQS